MPYEERQRAATDTEDIRAGDTGNDNLYTTKKETRTKK